MEGCEPRLLLSAVPATAEVHALSLTRQVTRIAPTAFEATVTKGADAGLVLQGTLFFRPTNPAHLSGQLVRPGEAPVPFTGSLHGSKVDLKFGIGGGQTLRGTGTVVSGANGLHDKVFVGGGKLLGPRSSDRGNWAMTTTTNYAVRIANDTAASMSFTASSSESGKTSNQSLAAGYYVDVYFPVTYNPNFLTSSSLSIMYTAGNGTKTSKVSGKYVYTPVTYPATTSFIAQPTSDGSGPNVQRYDNNPLSVTPTKTSSGLTSTPTVVNTTTTTKGSTTISSGSTTVATTDPTKGSTTNLGGSTTTTTTTTTTNLLETDHFTTQAETGSGFGTSTYIALTQK